MFRLRIEQIDQIGLLTRQSFQSRLLGALAESECKAAIDHFSEDDLNLRLQRYWDEAEQYFIRTEQDVFEFIRLKFSKDEQFWGSSAVQSIDDWLLSPFVPSKVKIKKLLELSSDIGENDI